ncbi:ATP-binding protein [Campylobacter mucosalis]|uniref:ATPase, AAA family (DUF4143 domain) n=1 Tax=Campylobacter mucosalis CCUG 21559 TaxID=1032067 RepID=A0A6G5QFQ5_9BACT|nr:ATP-binding protein [Campylobacter mucosalis]QCD44481.1 ATPase, AAA family (DUF4143 domain) [Campylobacter mucosalis CCUG 21559]
MYIKRAIANDIKEYMQNFPVLLISGARQVGKSTLALNLDIPNYITLDDISIYEAAKNDSKSFIKYAKKPIIIDEIQRVPMLLVAIKEFVDKNRINGQFILTGSANLKGFKEISDSLAGRIGIVELYGFSQKELSGKDENLIALLNSDLNKFVMQTYEDKNLAQKIIDGGYPEIAKITSQKAKYLWFSSYIRTYIESDAKELGNIRNMDKFITMYRLCMLRSANIFNKNELCTEAGLDNKTFDSYFSVLEHTYQLCKLAPYFNNSLKRLVKTPKIFATDTGILTHLLQITSTDELNASSFKGAIYETFVFDELLRANASCEKPAGIYYYRTSDQKEIDFILEISGKVIAIEVKSSKTISKDSFKHIYHLKQNLQGKFDKGVVFYTGDSVLKIDNDMFALPFGWME